MKFFYDKPTQVQFKEKPEVNDEPHWIGGIAYCDQVICGECGAIVECHDIDEIINLSWVDISKGILGDETEKILFLI